MLQKRHGFYVVVVVGRYKPFCVGGLERWDVKVRGGKVGLPAASTTLQPIASVFDMEKEWVTIWKNNW